jgi:chromosomal replication initiator protein
MISPYVVPGLKTKMQNLKRIVSVDAITQAITKYYDMDLDSIRAKNRTTRIVQARYVMCYMLRKHTDMSLIDVAQYLSPGITDHTTVMHGIRYIKGQLSAKHENTIKIVLNEIYI